MHDLGNAGIAFIGALGLLVIPAGIILARYLDPALLLTVGICLSVFSGNWDHVGIPSGAGGPDRAMIALGLFSAAWAGWRERGQGTWALRGVHLLMIAALAYAISSAWWAGTLGNSEDRFSLLDKFGLFPFLLFALSPIAFRTRAQRNILLTGLVIMGGYLGVTALLEALGANSLILPKYIGDPNLGVHYGRARGPFLEGVANGLALYAALIASAIALVTWRGIWARRTAAVIGLLCIVGIVATLTRQIWLGAAAASLVTMIATPQLRRWLIPAAAGAAVVAGLALVLIPGLSANASSRAESKLPVWDRLNSNRAAVNMVEARPLVGFGWGRFSDQSASYYQLAATYPLRTVGQVHSVVLGYAVELGLIGALLWLVALALAFVPAVLTRPPPELIAWRAGAIAYVTCWLVVSNFAPLSYTLPNYLLWLWPGVVAAPMLAARRAPRAASWRPAPATGV